MTGSRILVTGHKGYIGSVLIPMLIAANYDVVGMDADFYAGCDFGDAADDIQWLRKDIRDASADDFEGVEAVVHLAGLSNDPLGDLNPSVTDDINHLGTVRLGKLARDAGVARFIFSSSCSNYGAAGDALMNEEAAFNPVTPYGASKVKAEAGLAKLARDDFSPVFLRNATAYGLSNRHRFDLVVNNLTAWAYATGKVLLKSDGTPWRPVVHIEDISRGILAALQAPQQAIHNQAFNVVRPGENYRIRDIATIVQDIVPGCEVEYAADAGPDLRCYRVDASKITRELPEFRPAWTVRRGVQELYDAYQQVGVALEEFEGPRYQRISQIKRCLAEGKMDENLRWTTPAYQGR